MGKQRQCSIALRELGFVLICICYLKVGLLANSILYLEEDRYGNGKHLWDVKGDDFTEYAKVYTNLPVIFIIAV